MGSSSARESHPRALTEPCVNVSIHTAPPHTAAHGYDRLSHEFFPLLRLTLWSKQHGHAPLAPVALHNLLRYYEAFRPRDSHRYTPSCGTAP